VGKGVRLVGGGGVIKENQIEVRKNTRLGKFTTGVNPAVDRWNDRAYYRGYYWRYTGLIARMARDASLRVCLGLGAFKFEVKKRDAGRAVVADQRLASRQKKTK